MHRWIWDLRLRPPDVLEHEYPISGTYRDTPAGPLGPWMLPGEYVVKLTAGGKTYSQPLTVKMDPRVKTPLIGLTQQYGLARSLWSAANETFAALQALRKLPTTDALSAQDRELARLNGELARVAEVIEATDRAPTAAAIEAAATLKKSADAALAKWKATTPAR